MAVYNTAGRKCLLAYLRGHADRQFTAEALSEAMADPAVLPEGMHRMGKSSVYRQLAELCREGKVRKYREARTSCCLYQYVDRGDCTNHLHLKCVVCGQIQHLDCDASEELMQHILENHRFRVNGERSILYGCCASCAAKRARQEKNGEDDTPAGCTGGESPAEGHPAEPCETAGQTIPHPEEPPSVPSTGRKTDPHSS